jgi:anaerobic selenocysteine-containing dehydrogenase
VGNEGEADLSPLRAAVDQGKVAVLYVVDPGPAGSLGDVSWITEARRAGRIGGIVYQGVPQNELAAVADVVLPGAAWLEKDGCFTNDQGMLQAASKAIPTPGEAVEDWQILTSVAAALGLAVSYTSAEAVRADLGLADQAFNRPVSAENWLQSSNPMERLKWHGMFEDLAPVKGHNVQMEDAPQPTVIPLRLVTEEIARQE